MSTPIIANQKGKRHQCAVTSSGSRTLSPVCCAFWYLVILQASPSCTASVAAFLVARPSSWRAAAAVTAPHGQRNSKVGNANSIWASNNNQWCGSSSSAGRVTATRTRPSCGAATCRSAQHPSNPLDRTNYEIPNSYKKRYSSSLVRLHSSLQDTTEEDVLDEDVSQKNREDSSSATSPFENDDKTYSTSTFRSKAYILSTSAVIGVLSGLNIVAFKRLIGFVREVCYDSAPVTEHVPLLFIPVLGGLAVSILLLLGGEYAPGLRGTVAELDLDSLTESGVEVQQPPSQLCGINSNNNNKRFDDDTAGERNDVARFAQKAVAAIFTLGTGNSLGPEGPAVEAGMSLSRLCASITPPTFLFGKEVLNSNNGDDIADVVARNRLLLSCGAAGGVSAGFNAPLSGVFFALEIVQNALLPLDVPRGVQSEDGDDTIRVGQESLASESINISAILLSSVISALVSKIFLGNELALHLSTYELKNPLSELPLYLLLGVLSGLVAALFSGAAQVSKDIFDGTAGPEKIRDMFQSIPRWTKPAMGSLICGAVGIAYPQVLFFGYDTLNGLLASRSFPTTDAFVLLVAKSFTTAIAAASGLVGGTFAPSLFLGGMLGAGFHNIVADVLNDVVPWLASSSSSPFDVSLELSDMPAYAMVGAASCLSALFRAPLTASLLLFECTRDYDVLLPLMASAGVGSLIGDVVETALEEKRRDLDSVSWGDLGMTNGEPGEEGALQWDTTEENEALPSFKP